MKKKNKRIEEMSAKELKQAYISANKKIQYANKRIEHEESKEHNSISIKVKGTSAEFPYLKTGIRVEAEDPIEIQQSEIVIDRWKKEVVKQQEIKESIEKRLDNIEDAELAEIAWKYVIEGKTQQVIAKEVYTTQRNVSVNLKGI